MYKKRAESTLMYYSVYDSKTCLEAHCQSLREAQNIVRRHKGGRPGSFAIYRYDRSMCSDYCELIEETC